MMTTTEMWWKIRGIRYGKCVRYITAEEEDEAMDREVIKAVLYAVKYTHYNKSNGYAFVIVSPDRS